MRGCHLMYIWITACFVIKYWFDNDFGVQSKYYHYYVYSCIRNSNLVLCKIISFLVCFLCMYMNMYMYTSMHMYMHMYMYMHICIYVYVYVQLRSKVYIPIRWKRWTQIFWTMRLYSLYNFHIASQIRYVNDKLMPFYYNRPAVYLCYRL